MKAANKNQTVIAVIAKNKACFDDCLSHLKKEYPKGTKFIYACSTRSLNGYKLDDFIIDSSAYSRKDYSKIDRACTRRIKEDHWSKIASRASDEISKAFWGPYYKKGKSYFNF